MLGDSEQTSPSCVSVPVLQAQVHKHITALPGVRRISHGTQALDPAELGLLTHILVNEVPLPCQIFGVLWAVSFYLRKEKRLKLFDVCWEFSCKSAPRSGKRCRCCATCHDHTWLAKCPGSWCSVSLQITWGLPWLPEC